MAKGSFALPSAHPGFEVLDVFTKDPVQVVREEKERKMATQQLGAKRYPANILHMVSRHGWGSKP